MRDDAADSDQQIISDLEPVTGRDLGQECCQPSVL